MRNPPRNPKTILVRAPNWIGDQVLAYPFFYFLRKKYPEAHIAVVCADWVSSIQYLGQVDEVIPLPRARPKLEGGSPSLWNRVMAMEEAAKTLKARSWDLGVLLAPSFSAAWIFYRASVRWIVGYEGDLRKGLLHEPKAKRVEQSSHRADAFLRLIESQATEASAFWREPPPEDKDEVDDPPEFIQEVFDAEREWRQSQAIPNPSPESGYWVLAPGSQAESRSWSIEHYLELGKLIYAKTQLPAVVVGGLREIALLNPLSLAEFPWIDRIGQGSVADLWRVFREARFTVSNDSGLAHVAALCGSRTHVIWGAGDLKRTRPLGPGEVRWTLNPVDCWPCERNQCPLGGGDHLKCLAGIRPERVFSEMAWLWRA